LNSRKKTVCLISPFPPPYGGMAIQARKLITLLEEAGFEVNGVRTNTRFPDVLKWVTRVPGLRTLVNHVLFMVTLNKALKRADVVYFLSGFINFFWWVTYPALVQIKLSGKPVILSARGGDARRFFNRWGKLVAPIIRRIDVITTPSRFLQQAFEDAFDISPLIVPNIADLEQFTFRRREPLRPRLIVSRSLEEIYNVACVIRAFARMRERYSEATLAVVGDGSQREMLENLVKEMGLQKAVTFYGRVEHAQIQALYDENDIAVNASNVDNLPGTVLEAYACGLPIVSTRAGGIPYMVEDGVTGLLLDLDDDEALAARVIDLLEQPRLAQSLIANGRKEANKYSAANVRDVLVPLLNDMVI
jgi:glycosyltransferase involved in cell wall biosynthesis